VSDGRTIGPGVATDEVELTVLNPRERTDRRAATATRRGEEGALGLDRKPGIGVVDLCRQTQKALVVGADLESDSPLTRCWRHERRVQPLGDSIAATEPLKPGDRQDQGVRLAAVEAAQPSVDIAVKRMHKQVGTAGPDESDSAWTVGPDAVALGKILKTTSRVSHAHDERVARVGARKEGSNAKARMLVGRDVLRAVDREVDPAVE
jgi:hypothetical protein